MSDVYVCPEEGLDPTDPEYEDRVEVRAAVGPMLRNPDGSVMELVPACRKIIAEHQCANVQGQIVDMFTASAIIQVFDALNPTNREKLTAMARRNPPVVVAGTVWKVIKKAKG